MRVRRRTDRYPLSHSPLYGLKGTGRLAEALGVHPAQLKHLQTAHTRYQEWDEVKPSGGTRRIENPPADLKRVQGRITKLLMRIDPPELLFCPVAKIGPIDCARSHYGARQVWSIDIQNYFPSTSREKVFRFFRDDMVCAGDVAGVLTDLTCYAGHLPQGAPSSPILAYFAHRAAWMEIERLCVAADCRATLWIDDLTVSGNRVPQALRWSIESMLRQAGLAYHKEKFSHGRKLKTVGLMVGERAFDLPNSYYKDLRELRRAIKKAPVDGRARLRASLEGKLRYGRQVRNAAIDLW